MKKFTFLNILFLFLIPFLVFGKPKPKKYKKKNKHNEFNVARSPFAIGGNFRALTIGGTSLDNIGANNSQLIYKPVDYSSAAYALGLSINKYVKVLTIIDSLSFGLEPGINGGIGNSKNIAYYAYVEVPVFLSFKYGAGSSKYNGAKHGVGAGIGYQFRYVKLDFSITNISGFSPIAYLEYRLRITNNMFSLRLWSDLVKIKKDYELSTGKIDGPSFGMYGITLLYE